MLYTLFWPASIYCLVGTDVPYHPLPEPQCHDPPLNLVLVTSSGFVMFFVCFVQPQLQLQQQQEEEEE